MIMIVVVVVIVIVIVIIIIIVVIVVVTSEQALKLDSPDRRKKINALRLKWHPDKHEVVHSCMNFHLDFIHFIS